MRSAWDFHEIIIWALACLRNYGRYGHSHMLGTRLCRAGPPCTGRSCLLRSQRGRGALLWGISRKGGWLGISKRVRVLWCYIALKSGGATAGGCCPVLGKRTALQQIRVSICQRLAESKSRPEGECLGIDRGRRVVADSRWRTDAAA